MLERWSEVPIEKIPKIEDKVLKYLQCCKDHLKSYVSPTIGKKVLKSKTAGEMVWSPIEALILKGRFWSTHNARKVV